MVPNTKKLKLMKKMCSKTGSKISNIFDILRFKSESEASAVFTSAVPIINYTIFYEICQLRLPKFSRLDLTPPDYNRGKIITMKKLFL